jgi:hypothetical protein
MPTTVASMAEVPTTMEVNKAIEFRWREEQMHLGYDSDEADVGIYI